jgi:hypothetical protein
MKKLLLILCILFIFDRVCLAPTNNQYTIDKIYFDPMLYAFELVESNFDTDTINKLGYGGILQIGQEMIDEVNRVCLIWKIPHKFILSDRLNRERSELIWQIIQDHHNPKYHLSTACRVWNPLANHKYYDKIRSEILNAIYTNLLIKENYLKERT